MQIKCEYCGAYFSDTQEKCPTCGAPNNQLKRTASSVPTTIEELKAFIAEKGIPAEKIRFFIGVDYKEPKAFGIYKDEMTGNFVVYKNKADGSRAVRYEGKDEAYAVNEIYQKLRDEINRNNEQHGMPNANHGPVNPSPYQQRNTYSSNDNDPERRRNNQKYKILMVAFIIIVAVSLFVCISNVAVRSSGGHNGGFFVNGSSGYEYNVDDDDDDSYSWDNDDGSSSSYDDSWDTDWDSGSSWDSDWNSFDSDWGSDW